MSTGVRYVTASVRQVAGTVNRLRYQTIGSNTLHGHVGMCIATFN